MGVIRPLPSKPSAPRRPLHRTTTSRRNTANTSNDPTTLDPVIRVSVKNLRLRRGGDVTYKLKIDKCPTSTEVISIRLVLSPAIPGVTISPVEVAFTRQNYRQPQAIILHAEESTELARFEIEHTVQSTDNFGPISKVIVQIVPKQPLFVFAFGSGAFGRLGIMHHFDRRDTNASTPTPLGSKWLVPSQISCGGAHTAIIDANAHLYCFGRGTEGQLGQPHLDHVKAATIVPKLLNMQVTYVSCGANHTMCMVNGTRAYAWGSNSAGQLGLNLKAKHLQVPTRIQNLHTIRSLVCAGNYSFAITQSGDVYCSGSNIAGQLGLGDKVNRSIFVYNPHLSRIQSISSGIYHVIAHTTAPHMDVLVWGCGESGRLGLGHTHSTTRPIALPEFHGTRILQIAAGGAHTGLITEAGDLLMWGSNSYGQVGDGLSTDRLIPHRLRMFQGKYVKSIALGEWHSISLVDDACVYAWGFGEEGQLGLGDDRSTTLPLVINSLSGTAPICVTCGATHTMVVTTLEVACYMQQEKDRLFSQRAASQERRRLTWRKSMVWRGKHPDRKFGIDLHSLQMMTNQLDEAKESPRRRQGAVIPQRPQTARTSRTKDEVFEGVQDSKEGHIIPWRERPLSSRTSLRTALRQEFQSLHLLQKQQSTTRSTTKHRVCELLKQKEDDIKSKELCDPFEALLVTPRTPKRRERPQTAPIQRNISTHLTDERNLSQTDSLTELMQDDIGNDDAFLEEEMALGWDECSY